MGGGRRIRGAIFQDVCRIFSWRPPFSKMAASSFSSPPPRMRRCYRSKGKQDGGAGRAKLWRPRHSPVFLVYKDRKNVSLLSMVLLLKIIVDFFFLKNPVVLIMISHQSWLRNIK